MGRRRRPIKQLCKWLYACEKKGRNVSKKTLDSLLKDGEKRLNRVLEGSAVKYLATSDRLLKAVEHLRAFPVLSGCQALVDKLNFAIQKAINALVKEEMERLGIA